MVAKTAMTTSATTTTTSKYSTNPGSGVSTFIGCILPQHAASRLAQLLVLRVYLRFMTLRL